MTHTPGPWTIRQKYHVCHPLDDGKRCYCHGIAAAEGANRNTGDANVAAYAYGYTPEQAEANARLIAAAPELLAAAKGVQDIVDGMKDMERAWANELEALDAAIAKAEG